MAFPNNCNPRIIQVDELCGCTLTRASIRAMTPQDFEDQGFKEVGMDRIIAQTKFARATGVQERTLMDLLLSRMAPVKQVNMSPGASVIAPFFLVPQEHHINANYFEITAGVVHPTAGAGGIPDSAWNITVTQHSGTFSTAIPALEEYFLPGNFLTVIYKAGSGVGRTLQFKIIASVNADAGGVYKAKVTIQPNLTDAGWGALSGGDKAVYQPTGGLVIPLGNAVSDYQSYCNIHPARNNVALRDYWWQTMRTVQCYNDEALAALNAPLTSNWFKMFRQLPLSKQQAQQSAQEQMEFFNTVFYGQAIDENQTVENYTDLPQVTDPLNDSCVLEYNSTTKGIRTQLAECGRVTDFSGAALDFDTIKAMLYALKRERSNDGTTIDRIDGMTDRGTRANVMSMMIDYYKKKYGRDTVTNYQPNQKLMFGDIAAYDYDLYDFPDEGLQFALFSDPYYDDRLAATPSAHKSTGRAIDIIDWSDPIIALGGTASVKRNYPDPAVDALYKCVIKANVQHRTLNSKKIAVQVPRPNRHARVENFSDACPTITANVCEASS